MAETANPCNVVDKALEIIQSGGELSRQMEYELQHLPKQTATWELFYAMIDGGEREKYFSILVPLTMNLMYPLLTHCYQIANAKNPRLPQDEDLYQILSLKLFEDWLPNFDHSKGDFSAYIVNRFKREALQINKDEISEYMEQKYKKSKTISYEEYMEMRESSEHSSDAAVCAVTGTSEYGGASAEDVFLAKESRNNFQKALDLTKIRSNVEENIVKEISKNDAKDFVFLQKLFGGMQSEVLSRCLRNLQEKQKGALEKDA